MRNLLVLTLAFTACVAVQPPRLSVGTGASNSRWEYRQESQCHAQAMPLQQVLEQNTDMLNTLGREQWELVSVFPSNSTSERETCWVFMFKRRLTRDR